MVKLSEYNQAHPECPISRPAYYFTGTPPIGLESISYEDGYFATRDQLIEAFGILRLDRAFSEGDSLCDRQPGAAGLVKIGEHAGRHRHREGGLA